MFTYVCMYSFSGIVGMVGIASSGMFCLSCAKNGASVDTLSIQILEAYGDIQYLSDNFIEVKCWTYNSRNVQKCLLKCLNNMFP